MARLSRSTFLWVCALLLAFDWTIASVKPLRFFDVTEFIPLDQNPLVEKLQSFLEDKSNNPDIIILGSSLMLFPSVRLDDELDGKPARYDNWFIRHRISGHLHPRWFEELLKEVAGQPVKVANLGVQGSIVSDQYLMLRKSLQCGKTPSVVILELAPRSFLDNMHKQINNTPVYQVLADYSLLPDIFSRAVNFTDLKATLPGTLWHYYKVHADYRELIANIFASTLNRPMNDWEASQRICRRPLVSAFNPEMEWEALYKPQFPKYHDLEMYETIYNPPDEQFFQAEVGDCEKLLDFAREQRIKVVIADMPVTQKNLSILSPFYYKKYRQYIASLGRRSDVVVVPLSLDHRFTENDFEDSAHLNAAGGKKLFATLAPCAAQCAHPSLASRKP